MPIFENKGVKYDVSPEYIPDFASEYPDAVTVIERPDKPYRVKASQYDIFMQQHPEPDISVDEMRDTDNFFGDFGERLAAGAGRLVGSSTNLLKKITTPVESAVDWANEHTKGAAGAAAQSLAGTIPGLGMIAHIPDKNAGLERLSKNAEAFAEDMHERSDRYKGKSFSDLWSEGDYQGAFGSAFLDAAESAATSTAIAATGGAGLVAAGLTTASDKYDELSRENPEMGETLKWANAIGTGAAESLSEVFGAGMKGRTVRNILQKSGREAAANLVKKNFLDKIASFEGKHWFAMPIASEGLEEAGNALAGYAIDRLTGVERNDNIFKTMLDAGVAGSMGGAQFSPFIGAAKGYSAYQKRQITNRYKESSTFAGEILHEDVEKFNDAIVNRLKNPKSIQSFIDNVASVKNLNPEEKRKLEQYTVDLLNYNGYVDYVQSRIDEETRRRMDDIGRTANKDMGQVVTVKFPSSDQPVYITGGNIVFDEEGLVDAKQSDDILYYLDENGKVQQGRPEMFDSLIEQYPVEQLYADIINTVPGEVIAQEEMESEAADMQLVMFNPGDLVNLVGGRQGIVQQMSDDGGVIVEVDGMTEEIGVDSIIDNMSKNQTQNEDSSTDGDSRVLENVPEKTLESVVASLPKRNDGTIDYKAMTPQQQYEYTSLSESPQMALEDLRADIENKRSEISKSESRIEKASGGERASLRDEIRVKKQELADLEAFYRTVTPDVDSSAEENVILPASQTEIPINQESNTPESSIPMDEAGNPIYHQAEISDTLDALLDGSLTLEEVDQFVNNHISDAERRLTESGKKAPVMELDIDGYKARKKEWEEGRKPIEQEKSYWEDIKSKLQDARVKPGEEAAINLMRNTAPQSGEELAAQMLANGSIKLLQDDYRRETGGRISESRSLFGLFAGKDKGGVSIERAGEILMQADLENGTNFFDQNDPNAGRNAIIEVLSTARTRGDLINYIKSRREAKAEEMRQAEYNEYARWCEENYHLSPEDYESYEEDLRRQAQTLTDETVEYVSGEIADEIRDIEEELSEIDAILAENKNNPDETIERDDERRTGSLHERGDQLLQGEQSVPTGRTGEIETEHPGVDNGIRNADGAAQEGAGDEAVGRRYADEAQQGPVSKPQGLSGEEADLLLSRMESAAEISSEKELTPETWAETFDENNFIATPIGSVKMGGNQITKFFEKKRTKEFGMVGPTLSNPDVIIEEASEAKDGNAERGSSFLFIKTFNRNGEKVKFYASITVKQDGMEVSVSSHYMNKNKVKRALQESGVLYIREALLSNSSEWRLAEHRDDVPDLLPTQESNASENKDTHSFRNNSELSEKIADAEANTDINPTEAQKEAGNYKKGHVRVGTFDISIEQPKGSVRSGVDANGKKWETTMQNTYGYIRGTEGVDGDHIDVFLSDDIDGWNGRKAFVVDQYNEDGSFDEHKVMLGFNEAADAETAYFANYDKNWAKKHKTVVTAVNLEDFEKWIGSSHRKTKAFAEYKSVKTDSNKAQQELDKREAENNDNLRFRTAKESDVSSFAQKHQLEEADVKKYAESMKAGNLGGASYAFKSIKRSIRLANDQLSLGEFVKVFSPVKAELFDKFGNVDELRDSYVKQAQDERNAMEAARKREEEAAAAERKRLEEFELMSSEALDRAYLEAVEAQDESRMRDLVNEAARRKGYLSTDEFRMAHRAPSYDEEGIDKSMVDVAQNKDNIRDSLDEQFRMNRDKNREESIAAISEALDAIDKGEKPMVTIYRAVPKSLKEGSVRNGDWVTLSEAYARQHGNHALEGDYRMMEERVPAENLYWDGNDINEWGYDDKSDYLYKDTRNNRKLNDLVTRDDKGNIIPLSQRFNARKSDPRFRFIGEQGAARLDAAEEATTRLDNLNVAREMESAFNEKKQRIEKLRKSEPVEITGWEIEPSDDLKQYKKNALEYGKRLRGEYTNKDTGETVMVGKNAIKEVLNHDYKNAEQLQSVAAIPQIIENAVYIESQANTDDKVDAEKFDYYVCGMKIGGEDYTVRAVIVTPKEGTRYYDHKLSKIEKGKLLDSLIGITTPGFNQTTSLNSDIKDTKLLSLLQINEKENARKIKLATGWERGADGKWRYEVPDFEVDPKGLARKDRLWANLPWGKDFDNLNGRLLDGEELSEEELARYDELSERAEAMRSSYRSEEVRYLDDYVKDPRLFEAYPELRQMRVELYKDGSSRTGATFYEAQNLIRVNEAALETEDLRSLIAHEVQHAIQASEGFARGGNESTYKKHLNTLKEKRDAWSMVDEFKEKQKELGDEARQIDVYNALVDEYHSLGMTFGDGFVPSREAFDKGFNLWVRGYDNEGYEDAYNEYQSLTEKYGLGESRNRYKELSGEVEARNVQRRLSMTPEERRRMLAEETEDVAREDQLFLDDALGKPASYAPASGNIEEVNERFNEDLQRQIDGSLPKGHVYKLGNPSRFLQAAGFPYLPIELRADKLATKASEKYKSNHPFNLTSVENLPQAIANPIAVFDSKTRIDAKVVLTELESNGDNFVVAIQVNRKVGNIEINSVRSIYPKDYVKDIYSWINDGLLKWVDKKKATDFISNSSTPANVDDKNSSFSSATKIVESFVNPTLDEGKISSAVDELASGLHIPIHIIRDVNDITDDDKDTQRKKRGSKGWYDMETGEVYLVLPNAESIADAQATILHEVVAHKGLRGLLGEKFDDMMDSVYRNLPEDVRRKVTRAGLSRYGGDFRIATEEYLASVAENGVSEPSIWQKIKSAIRGFFRSLGIDLRMRDEDIAYMLWKSKNRLEKGDSLVTIIHKVAKDGNMRDTLLFRDPLGHGGTILNTPSEDRRTMIRTIGAVSEGARSFSAMTREFYKRFREGYQDQKIHIRDFQKAVEKETGHKVKDYEDAYIYENTTQGRAEYDVNHFKANEFAALVNEVARLSRDGKNIDKDKRRKVDLYMKAKHGLERNEVMRREALASVEQPSPELIESIGNKDFAGLTAITKALSAETKGMDEDIVRRFVEEFEKENDTKKLWEAVGKATRATLEKMYQCNLISRESRDRISGKYEYYVPLKEWEETTAGDIWDYIDSNRDIVSNPIKKAKGRTSMAGDILANIASDYESATMMGYKNLVKLRFANLVRNSKTGMASVSRQWYVKSGVDTEGRTLWEPVSATGLTEDAETNASIINDFEEKMKELQEKGEAKTQQEVLNLGVPIKDWQEQQHVVRVKEGGRDLLVYINGNPVVSQAVNGINRASLDNVVLKGLNNVRKFMMQNYTSRNINFILRNFARDFFYANTMNFVKYGAAYEGRFLKNYPLALWRIAKVEIGGRTDLEYEAFLRGGGKTGYVATFGYDKYKKEVERLLNRNAGGRVRVKDVFNVLGGYFEMVNGVVENGGRFTTYLTAKESGMTELQSINAAKEVSVNFNRRGSGAMGAVYMQNFFHFFNAAIQGTHNFAHAAKHNPVRAGAAIAMWATLGFAVSTLSKMLFGDDDEYNDIPDYVRQNNLILPMGAPGKYVLLPLPVELRMLFGLGDMSAQYTRGEYKGRDFTSDVMGKLMDVLPLSIESNATDNLVEAATRTFTPDMISPITEAYLFNENYFGKRITGRNEFNKYVPEYHKVTTGTSKAIIKASERLNSLSGGDYASKGKLDYALLNPSAVEYLFEQYLGGVGKAIAQCYKTVEGAVTGDVQLRNIPVVSGLTYDTENMVPRNYTNERYNHYVKEYEEMQSRDRMYRKGLEGGKDLSGNYKSFANSRAYRRYQTTGFYKKAIESMYDMARLMDGEEKKALYEQARKTKEMMINELDKIGDE
ncbi:LPD38 domain-containing protein [Parabacteroides merdae]|uniref:LPD38 domain-containing protein n=1 Tax=Parabacteroides merdae TaxID=46503 RepID=UPI00321B2B49